MAVNLSRNTKVFITTATLAGTTAPTFTAANTWALEIQDGWNFSQGTNATTVQLSEAGATPSRGQRSFNDTLNPVEWSFSTYLRPYRIGTGATSTADAPELMLWSALMSTALTSDTSTTSATPVASISTTGSDVHQLATFGLIFVVDNATYAVEGCAVNQAEVSFDLTGIATAAWSGMGTTLKKITTSPVAGTSATAFPIEASNALYAKTFITNKLSTVALSSEFTGGTTYNVPITGGTITYSNNIEYVTPDTLGSVDSPIGYYTGTRSITGNLTAYLRTGGTDTGKLLDDMLVATSMTEPKYRLDVNVGGSTAGNPFVVFNMPYVSLQIPTVDVQDVVSTTINFTAQGATGAAYDAAANNELTVKYNVA